MVPHNGGPWGPVGGEVNDLLVNLAKPVDKGATFAERGNKKEYPPDDYHAEGDIIKPGK